MRRRGRRGISMLLAVILLAEGVFFGGGTDAYAGSQAGNIAAERTEGTAWKTVRTKPYGVFPGLKRKNKNRLKGYQTVVIDAEYFTAADLAQMHRRGQKVYSYLNVGSLETYRPYYQKFESLTIGSYENWPDEYWLDVSRREWQNYVVHTLAKKLVQKGVDGFFLDNLDVYDICHKKRIYNGLMKILKGLKKYKKSVIINGGDVFVTEALKRKDLKGKMVEGINQECVVTRIDFRKKSFTAQSKAAKRYYKNYLKVCKKNGLTVYLTEYAKKGSRLEREAVRFAKAGKYRCYVAHTIELNGR